MGYLKRLGLSEIGRQTVKGGAYSYFGVIIGFLTTGYLFPNYLSKEQIGLINLILSVSLIFASFGNLGMTATVLRLFPYFRNKRKGHNGLFFLVLSTIAVGSLLAGVLYYFFGAFLTSGDAGNSLFNDYQFLIYPSILFAVGFSLLDAYNIALGNAVTGTLLNEIVKRVIIFSALLLFIFWIDFSFEHFLWVFVSASGIIALVLSVHIYRNNHFFVQPQLHFLRKRLRNVMFNVSVFGYLRSFGNIVVQRVDTVLIAYFLTLEEVGVYSTVFYFTTIIFLPKRALVRISESHIAQHMKSKDFSQISRIYQQSSLNQYAFGLLLFLLIWCNTHNLFQFLPEGFDDGKMVLLYIGLAQLTALISAQSGSIIELSRYYRWSLIFLVVFSLSVIIFDLVFIPTLGLTGAALASGICIVLYQVLKVIFVYRKFGLIPISKSTLYFSILGAAVYAVSTFVLPVLDNFILDIIYRSALIVLLYSLLSYVFKLSYDLNNLIDRVIKLK